jgi:uncharacterized protein (DUF433 family)
MKDPTLYGGHDPREMPAYGIAEAAHYLQLPASTLRAWIRGRSYPTDKGQRWSAPLIPLPAPHDDSSLALSFVNMVEAHVLKALRRTHRVSMYKVREALTCLEDHFPSPHPLADQAFATNQVDLFIEKYGELVNLNQDGQLVMRKVLDVHLSRIERDPKGVPIKLYLFTHDHHMGDAEALADEPRAIAMDPYVSFGRPMLVGTGIPTAIVAERYKAGESIQELAYDYDLLPSLIEEAIRCELEMKAA